MTGVLAYSEVKDVTELVWYDRDGRRLEAVGGPQVHTNPSLSHDGRHLAVQVGDEESRVIRTWDLVTERTRRTSVLTPDPADPVWGPPGHLAYLVDEGADGWSIYRWDINGTAPPGPILTSPKETIPTGWSPDGSTLLYIERSDRTDDKYDVFALELDPRDSLRVLGPPRRVLGQPNHELSATLSPSGNLIAFASDEFDDFEVFIEPFPSTGLRCQISSEGGWEPLWGLDDQELFYLEESGDLMVAEPQIDQTRIDDPCGSSPARRLFTVQTGHPQTARNHYAFSRSTGRFLVNLRVRSVQTIDVIFNWPARVREATR